MSIFKNKLAPDFSDGVDRKLLKKVRDRFMQINADRLNKTYEGLTPRQQDILLVIPLLYHINHPLMPGYVAREVPSGVSGYEPDKQTLSVAKSFSHTFKFKADKRQKNKIHALYMMGSTGTLAHSEQSDVDLWLCHEPGMDDELKEILADKAKKIDDWANHLGLELHTFLMDADKFKSGDLTNKMDKESSGSAQHYLLLDEFYRTAILLAGRYPIWWLIPPACETDYSELTSLLLTKRFIKETEVIDFGSAATIPKNELVGAALWQLYKGIDSPYKSVLKILLAEVYAQEMPAKSSLSQSLKQAVYDDDLLVEDLDPYLLVYRRLEAYLLANKEHKRLDLVRKSFYLKVSKKLSKPPAGRTPSWQRKTLEKVVKTWGWPDEKYRYLDSRHTWKVDQVIQERQVVVAELSYCYRFLSQYARGHGIDSSISSNDMNLLGRKLYSVFQKKAGKVEYLNPGIANDLWEENLAIHHASTQPFLVEQNDWLVYRNLNTSSDASFETSLKKSSHLIELIVWLYFNRILSQSTRMSFVPGNSDVRFLDIQSMIRALSLVMPLPMSPVKQATFQKKLALSHLVLFINLGIDPLKKMSERGMYRLSDRTDSLGYSTERHNLVKTIDQIAVNTWNEVMAHRYEMGDTLMQNLQSYLQICLNQLNGIDCQLSVFCFCPQRAQAIASRVEDLFHAIKKAFFQTRSVRSARYVIEVESGYYVFQYIDGQFRYFICDSEANLLARLAQKPSSFSPVIFDQLAETTNFTFQELLPYNLPGVIQVIYLPVNSNSNNQLDAYKVLVLDELGSMLQFDIPGMQEELLQSSLFRCLQSLMMTRQMNDMAGADASLLDVKIYRANVIKSSSSKQAKFKLKEINNIQEFICYELRVTAIREFGKSSIDVNLIGPDLPYKDFLFNDYANQQFDALVHFAKHQVDFDQRYPFQIVDIALSDAAMSLGFSTNHGLASLDIFAVFALSQQKLALALENQALA
ncbi:MAG: adenylate cyclase class 1 [Oleiphilaceae bacterium]|jgi:adenylate cyclase class 1